MTDQQKRATTAVSLAIVTSAALFTSWLAVTVAFRSSRGDEMPGELLMQAVASWGALAAAVKILPPVITTGLAFVGGYRMKDALFYALLCVSALGLICSIYLILEISSKEIAATFWQNPPMESPLDSYEKFLPSAQKGLGVLVGWFAAVICAELGLRRK